MAEENIVFYVCVFICFVKKTNYFFENVTHLRQGTEWKQKPKKQNEKDNKKQRTRTYIHNCSSTTSLITFLLIICRFTNYCMLHVRLLPYCNNINSTFQSALLFILYYTAYSYYYHHSITSTIVLLLYSVAGERIYIFGDIIKARWIWNWRTGRYGRPCTAACSSSSSAHSNQLS